MTLEGPPKKPASVEDVDFFYPERDFERSVRIKEAMLAAVQNKDEEAFRKSLAELTELRGHKLALIESAYVCIRGRDSARAMNAIADAQREFPNDADVAKAAADVFKNLP
jgi:hypothetical protein